MGLLDGKVAFITGGARGQGREHALAFAREGADIAVVDIAADIDTAPYPLAREEDLAETVRLVENLDRRALSMVADVRSQQQLDAAVEATINQFGQIDLVSANAGIWAKTPFWELSDAQWDDMIGTNLTGVWRTAKAVAPHMMERRRGSIVMTSSINGLEPGLDYAHYCSSKFGVIGLMKTVALELAPYGIRCNAVCPSAIDTGMTNWQGAYDMFAGGPGGTREDLLVGGRGFHALAGVGAMPPHVVADAALWLHSDLAARVTGVAVPVDAGHLILTGVNPSPVDPPHPED